MDVDLYMPNLPSEIRSALRRHKLNFCPLWRQNCVGQAGVSCSSANALLNGMPWATLVIVGSEWKAFLTGLIEGPVSHGGKVEDELPFGPTISDPGGGDGT